MTSERQIEANRKNARRSTGPKTEEGKARSSRNAFILHPWILMQRTLVDQIAVLTIRIRRWLANGQKQFEWECTYQNTDTPNYDVDDALLIGMRYEAQLNRHLHRNLQALERLKGPNPHSHTSVADQVCPYLHPEPAPTPGTTAPTEMASFGKNAREPDPNEPPCVQRTPEPSGVFQCAAPGSHDAPPDSHDASVDSHIAAPVLPYSHEIPPTALTYASATPEEQYRVRMASFRNSAAGNPGAAAALGACQDDPHESAKRPLEGRFDAGGPTPDEVVYADEQTATWRARRAARKRPNKAELASFEETLEDLNEVEPPGMDPDLE